MHIDTFLSRLSPENRNKVLDVLNFIAFSNTQGWIAGGFLRRILENNKIFESDIDLFFPNQVNYDKFKDYLTSKGFKLTKENDKNSTWLGLTKSELSEPIAVEIQLIKVKFFSEITELIDEFDFTNCMLATNLANPQEIVHGSLTLLDIGQKRLVVNKITYPIASLRRLIKYVKQGYYACEGCLQQLLLESFKLGEAGISQNMGYID